MDQTRFYQYFPAESPRETGRYRDIFSSHGQPNHVQVCTIDAACTLSSQRVVRRPSSSDFKAVQPSMPLLPPVDLSGFREEPCLQSIHDENSSIKKKLRNVEERMRIFSGYLVMDNASEMQDFLGSDIYKKEVNYMYTCGALKYEKWPTQPASGILFYPSGPNGASLATVEITEGKDGTLKRQHLMRSGDTSSGRIYGLDTARAGDGMLCLTRTTDMICVSSLAKEEDGAYRRRLLKRAIEKPGTEVTSAALCPFSLNEYAQMTSEGEFELKSVERKGTVASLRCEHRFMCLEPYWQCSWGLHPREVVITDRTGVALYDIRRKLAPNPSDLFTLPHASLLAKDRVCLHKRHTESPFYHVVATSYSLLLIDQRFPDHPVLKWNHLLLSSPAYMEILYDVTKMNSSVTSPLATSNQIEDVVLLGCQDSAECHAFQLTTGNGVVHPSWQGLPWRISKPSDFATMSSYGSVDPADGFRSRLSAPLAGVTAFSHRDDTRFTCLQMTSYGDIFYQTYTNCSASEEKTFNSGPGSSDLSLDDACEKVSCDWLKKAEEKGLPEVRILNTDSEAIYADILAEEFKKRSVPPQTGCQFCPDTDISMTTACDVCPRCGTMVEHSQRLCDALQRGPEKPLPYVAQNAAAESVQVDEHVRGIDTEKAASEDAFSEIIMKLWRFDDSVPPELLKRSEEEFLNANPKIKAQVIKEEPKELDMGVEGEIESESESSCPSQTQSNEEAKPRDLASLLNLDLTWTADLPCSSLPQQTTAVKERGAIKQDSLSDGEETLHRQDFSLVHLLLDSTQSTDHTGKSTEPTSCDVGGKGPVAGAVGGPASFQDDDSCSSQSDLFANDSDTPEQPSANTTSLFDLLKIESEPQPKKRLPSPQLDAALERPHSSAKRLQTDFDLDLDSFSLPLFRKDTSTLVLGNSGDALLTSTQVTEPAFSQEEMDYFAVHPESIAQDPSMNFNLGSQYHDS